MVSLNKALRINPSSYKAYNWKGTIFSFGSENTDFVEGIENFHIALYLAQGSLRVSTLQGLMYVYQGVGYFEKAENYNFEILKIKGDSSMYFSALAVLESSKGNWTKAAMLSEKAMKDPMGYLRSLPVFGIAGVYAFKGDRENAYKCPDEYNTMDFYPDWQLSLTKYDPLFESIRDEERFQRILKDLESK